MSTSNTFSVMDFRPLGKSDLTKLDLHLGFEPGMVLHVIASTEHRSVFNVCDAKGNILLHVNPRFDENVFVFNSHEGGWGKEERLDSLPIQKNNQYHLHIACHTAGYRIFINGEQIYFYKHRLRYHATTFEIAQANTYYVSYSQNTPQWSLQEMSGVNCEFGSEGKVTPHEVEVEHGIHLSWIIITAIANSNAGFSINFVNASGENVLHFNPRFTENCVVLNSWLNRAWGKEERIKNPPFEVNKKFILAIDNESQLYKIFVNGAEYATYKHRENASSITKIKFNEGIKLLNVVYSK